MIRNATASHPAAAAADRPPPRGSRGSPAGLTLVCLPPAGASAGFFAPLAAGLRRRGVRLLPIELPGHGQRRAEPPVTTVDALLDELLPVVRSAPRPYALLGHSMGALVALAAAGRLQDRHQDQLPAAVVASAMTPPPGPGPLPPPHRHARTTGHLDARASDDELLRSLVRCGGLPESVLSNHHARRLVLPPLRADAHLLRDLASGRDMPARPLDRPVLALSGASDELAPPFLVSGWSRWTTATFTHRVFTGRHSFLAQDSRATTRWLADELGALSASDLAA